MPMRKITVAVCVDDQNGMGFGDRRQSRDRELISDFMQECSSEKTICIGEYSRGLFESYPQVTVLDDLLAQCPDGGVCFAELQLLKPFLEEIETLILYRWNRLYPADLYFDLQPEKNGFFLTSSCDFVGSSHDKITKEIYRK